MASDFRKIFHIPGTEQQFWDTLYNERNLENALNLDSRNGMHPRVGHEFIWEINGHRIAGKVAEVDLANTASTRLVFHWRFDELDLRDIWPEEHFAQTTLITGDQSNSVYVELIITNIPGESSEYDRARRLWGEHIIEKIGRFLQSEPELERPY